VLVLDHHLPGSALPEVQAIVNPSRADCHAGQEALCAAGVAFLTLVATNRTLRTRGFFTAARPEPDLRQGLDLVALATVADVAPLTGLNRAFVRQGLGVLARRQRPGLAALADVARLTAPPTSRDLGFALGPRINAGGRIGEASLGVCLLSSTCPHEAANLAERLDRLNSERRAIDAGVLEAAIAQIEARDPSAPLVWAAAEGWHPGVLGIVASRLKERFNRPALAIGLDETLGRGSGRSVAGVDLGAAVGALAEAGVLLKGGGHAMAAGLTLERPRLDEAMTQLSARLAAQGAGGGGPTDLVLDGALAPGGATVDLVEAMERAGPYGQANPAPRLGFGEVVVQSLRLTANGHALLRLGRAGGRVEAVAFGAGTKGLAPALEAAAATRAPLHVAGRLEIDDWGGRRRAKLRIEDLARP
ncbi:MAG: DHHA1 domain-containing protein, partial [Pseudomonadota bacterium]